MLFCAKSKMFKKGRGTLPPPSSKTRACPCFALPVCWVNTTTTIYILCTSPSKRLPCMTRPCNFRIRVSCQCLQVDSCRLLAPVYQDDTDGGDLLRGHAAYPLAAASGTLDVATRIGQLKGRESTGLLPQTNFKCVLEGRPSTYNDVGACRWTVEEGTSLCPPSLFSFGLNARPVLPFLAIVLEHAEHLLGREDGDECLPIWQPREAKPMCPCQLGNPKAFRIQIDETHKDPYGGRPPGPLSLLAGRAWPSCQAPKHPRPRLR